MFNYCTVFNSFPQEFKLFYERKDFLKALNMHYNKEIEYSNCCKKFCKICHPLEYEKRIRSFMITTEKEYNFHRFFLYN